jgi:hypothetical protein
MGSQVTINVGPPPRGQGGTTSVQIGLQSVHGTFAWGGSPGSLTLVFVNNGQANMVGQLITMTIGVHYFAGICKTDVSNVSSRGGTREMVFEDMRTVLQWDNVKCVFNIPIRRYVNGVWLRRYMHVYPADWPTGKRTYTNGPLLAWQIVAAILKAPTVTTSWAWDLTGNGMFPGGLMNQPVYNLDWQNGIRLDSALNDITARGGLVYTLDPLPFNNFRLVWMRKGYGLIPVLPPFDWPNNSDDRRLGVSLSGNATTINVVGDRNRYLVLNLPLKPDWNTAWQQFLNSDSFWFDIFQNEKDPATGIAYTSFPNDVEQWNGANAAKLRAMQLTVSEYVNLRNARASSDGTQFIDLKKFAGKSRMNMPAMLYIQMLVFRAYVPNATGIVNAAGGTVPFDAINILDEMPCLVTYDPLSGTMTADPNTLSDGNGVGLVQGVAFGQDLFELVNPERVTNLFFSATNRPWSATPFQIDDSGEERFVIFDNPCFTSENLLTVVNGVQVLNANPTIAAANAQAALTLEMEPFNYNLGSAGRTRLEYVAGLMAEYVGTVGHYTEIPYSGGLRASDQAQLIANNLLLCQYFYVQGGYKFIQTAAPLGTLLGSLIDRVELEMNPSGFTEVVDFTTERERAHFEPERDLERRTVQNSLFPGQDQLKQKTREQARLTAGIKSLPRDLLNTFINFLRGNFTDDMKQVRLDPKGLTPIPTGSVLPAGTPVFKPAVTIAAGKPVSTLSAYPANYDPTKTTVFCGVTVRDGESALRPFYVKAAGETYCLVQGPCNTNDGLGRPLTVGQSFLIRGGNIAVAQQAITDTSTQLIKVYLSQNAVAGSGDVWLPG